MEQKHMPSFKKAAFICPHCHVYSTMDWYSVWGGDFSMEELAVSKCFNCKQPSIWLSKKILHPEAIVIEPNPDMPEKAKVFFTEAQSIIGRSPRAASALLRLSLEEIVIHLKGTGNNLNQKIQSLSLPEDLMTLFEACRLYGNQAAHPGVIDFNEDNSIDVAYNLSNFINVIVALKISPFMQAKALIKDLNSKKTNQS